MDRRDAARQWEVSGRRGVGMGSAGEAVVYAVADRRQRSIVRAAA